MASFIALAVSAPVIYAIQKSMNVVNSDVVPPETASGPQMMMKATESAESARSAAPLSGDIVPEPSIFTSEPVMILTALLSGAAIFLGVFLITRFYLKRKKTIAKQKN
jgi:hypothetical protein